jgi:cell division protein FtsW
MDKKGLALLLAVSLLFIMGVVMVFNTTSAEILDGAVHRDVHYALIRQILYAVCGLALATFAYWIGYDSLMRLSGPLLVLFSVLLILVLIPGVGLQLNGARRWLSIFGNSFQPSEFVKYLIPMYFIQKIVNFGKPVDFKFFLRLVAEITIPMLLILVEPDNGTVFIIGVTITVLCILTRIPLRFFVLPLCALMLVGGTIALKTKHVPDRIRVFMNPELDLLGKGHQPHQAKIAAGSGKLFGRGFGESLQKMNYLPEARSDYIAAIFAEEFGFVGVSLMILLYLVICFLGYKIAISTRDLGAFYLISIFVFLICFQAFFNLGVVSGLLPSKGTTLPFFSQGGTSLLVSFLSVSVILSVNQESLRVHEEWV